MQLLFHNHLFNYESGLECRDPWYTSLIAADGTTWKRWSKLIEHMETHPLFNTTILKHRFCSYSLVMWASSAGMYCGVPCLSPSMLAYPRTSPCNIPGPVLVSIINFISSLHSFHVADQRNALTLANYHCTTPFHAHGKIPGYSTCDTFCTTH